MTLPLVGLLEVASIFPTTLSLAERHVTITGQVAGWFFVGASLGGMSLPSPQQNSRHLALDTRFFDTSLA